MAKPKILSTSNVKAKAYKPDPGFEPYKGPAITTGNMQKFRLKETPVIPAEEVTEVPVIPEKELIGLDPGEIDDLVEKQPSEVDSKGRTEVVEGLCKAITKAGNPCKMKAIDNGFCRLHKGK